jgi:hypothetical protein
VLVDDGATTFEDEPVNIYWLLYNDIDPELDTITITEISQPTHGDAVLEEDQTVTYTPDSNWSGDDSFTYTATDGNGNYETAAVLVTVEAVNDHPTADDLQTSTNEDTPVTITFTGSDIEGDELSWFIVNPPANGKLSAIDGDQVTYFPAGNFNGTTAV